MTVEPAETWIFGYGSLMWSPGFAYVEARRARLAGFHRAFCVYSIHYRGTERQPGLVLGLDRGGACDGIAFRVAPDDKRRGVPVQHRDDLIDDGVLIRACHGLPSRRLRGGCAFRGSALRSRHHFALAFIFSTARRAASDIGTVRSQYSTP